MDGSPNMSRILAELVEPCCILPNLWYNFYSRWQNITQLDLVRSQGGNQYGNYPRMVFKSYNQPKAKSWANNSQ